MCNVRFVHPVKKIDFQKRKSKNASKPSTCHSSLTEVCETHAEVVFRDPVALWRRVVGVCVISHDDLDAQPCMRATVGLLLRNVARHLRVCTREFTVRC